MFVMSQPLTVSSVWYRIHLPDDRVGYNRLCPWHHNHATMYHVLYRHRSVSAAETYKTNGYVCQFFGTHNISVQCRGEILCVSRCLSQSIRTQHWVSTRQRLYTSNLPPPTRVCHIAGEFVKTIRNNQPELAITDEDVLCVMLAGLFHDLGHGPFSHIFDSMVVPLLDPSNPWKVHLLHYVAIYVLYHNIAWRRVNINVWLHAGLSQTRQKYH